VGKSAQEVSFGADIQVNGPHGVQATYGLTEQVYGKAVPCSPVVVLSTILLDHLRSGLCLDLCLPEVFQSGKKSVPRTAL